MPLLDRRDIVTHVAKACVVDERGPVWYRHLVEVIRSGFTPLALLGQRTLEVGIFW
jgi:hypothetical protein